jgi:hypothetical protein
MSERLTQRAYGRLHNKTAGSVSQHQRRGRLPAVLTADTPWPEQRLRGPRYADVLSLACRRMIDGYGVVPEDDWHCFRALAGFAACDLESARAWFYNYSVQDVCFRLAGDAPLYWVHYERCRGSGVRKTAYAFGFATGEAAVAAVDAVIGLVGQILDWERLQ